MIKDLLIKNLVLMQSCYVEFHKGLNILTGETGSGKTAILHAIKLLLGRRFDSSLLRFGEKKGSVQATFEVRSTKLLSLLEEHSIEMEDSTLIVYREVSLEGKNKIFLNDRCVTLSFLQQVGEHLMQAVDQNSQHDLKSDETYRILLDVFASLEEEVARFADLFASSKELGARLHSLEERLCQKQRELETCLAEQKELQSISWKEGEEEALFQEYSLFSKAQEVQEKTHELLQLLQEGPSNIVSLLRRSKHLCHNLSPLHSMFQESFSLLQGSCIAVEETILLLEKVLSLFEVDPKRCEHLEDKLRLFHHIKKKYGPTSQEWDAYKKKLEARIELFDSVEEEIESASHSLQRTEQELSKLALNLTSKRKTAAAELAPLLEKELSSLNMGLSKVQIQVTHKPRSGVGEDAVCFLLQANTGEALSSVKENASGGELSRLLLAIKVCLAEKNTIPTLIFDEIDANVGGETASLIAEKLRDLAKHCQILCITHFPQVAKYASSHLLVKKIQEEGRTYSIVAKLDKPAKQKELLRMLGGKNPC